MHASLICVLKLKDGKMGNAHCNVGTMPLTDGVPLGVAAGVAGVATGPD